MTDSPTYTVFMHPDLVYQLDECFSPMDGLQAIDDLFIGLPQVHRSPQGKRRRRSGTFPKALKTHRARLDWCGMDVLYVQIRDELHVVDFGFIDGWPVVDPDPTDRVVVLPDTREQFRRKP